MLESPGRAKPEDIHFNPSPDDPEYFEKVMQNAAEDREDGESNPNFKSKPN